MASNKSPTVTHLPWRADYDPVSQLQGMDMEGLDVAVLFRTSPLHCDETLEAGVRQ